MTALVATLSAAAVWVLTVPRARLRGRVSRQSWRLRRRPAAGAELVRLLSTVAAGLRAGGRPETVWGSALGRQLAVPTPHLLAAVVGPGAERQIEHVVAACRVAEELGAPLAAVLDRAVATAEAEQEAATETAAALAGPRQTVRLLSWLPLWGVLLGALVGASPLTVLLDGGIGTLCLLGGIGCAGAGRVWVDRLLTAARAGDG